MQCLKKTTLNVSINIYNPHTLYLMPVSRYTVCKIVKKMSQFQFKVTKYFIKTVLNISNVGQLSRVALSVFDNNDD